ncbi:DUF4942 domain-containing protein [Pseudomonas putida]|uniref:DUF4942 domain-containing protein n=1 Tax=Pseudomonas putida TaxID=303 RepID=A0A7Y8D2Q7_PSEPU|nr:DUF4942 domain-containing protein [Pseudomonas putida]NWC82847.1 DUF4942 domain-containing protein [Pseudomonas putida]
MNHFKQLALPTTLSDLLKARQAALRLIEDAHRSLQTAEDLLSQHGRYLKPYGAQLKEDLGKVRCELDSKMWRRAMDLTGFKQLMDTQEVGTFERSLEHSPPEFTEDNIRATFIDMQLRSTDMFRRGVFNVFRWLSKAYRTNKAEPFRIGEKVIMKSMVRPNLTGGLYIQYGMNDKASDQLNDIDRVMKTLDKQPFQPRSLESAMNAAFENLEVFEDSYYRAKAFKNGNLHLEFKRPDLLDKVNEQIAEHYTYGALPDARHAA